MSSLESSKKEWVKTESDEMSLSETSKNESDKTSSDRKEIANGTNKGKKYISRSIDDRKEVLRYAARYSIRAASKMYNVDRKLIRNWRTSEAIGTINIDVTRKRLQGGGAKPNCVELEDRLYDWIKDKREAKLQVSRAMVLCEAKKMYSKLVKDGRALEGFKFSNGWFCNFMVRYKLSFSQHK